MRALNRLVRSAPQAFRSLDAMEHGFGGFPAIVLREMISLRPLQLQQSAGFSAYKKPPSEDEVDDAADLKEAARKGHLPRVNHSNLRKRAAGIDTPLVEGSERDASPQARSEKIRDLLRTMTGGDDASGAFKFVDSFFEKPKISASVQDVRDQLAALGYSDEAPEAAVKGSESQFDISTPAPLDEGQEEELLAELRGLRRGSQRVVLQKLLQGGMLRADPSAMAEWNEIQAAFKPPEGFRMKVVDVNRTCKGTRSGGLYRFSAMVVVGNGEGVLGWGQGKAAEMNAAVRKAYHRACRNLYPIPRFNRHTIPEPATAKFGKVKVVMYPKSSGRGIVASTLVADICKLAGIHDIGVKIHGSRNPRNTVKCLFEAFDGMKTHEEIMAGNVEDRSKLVVAVPAGRFGKLKL